MDNQLTFDSLLDPNPETTPITALIDDITHLVAGRGITPQENALALAEARECALRLSESEITWEVR